MQPPPLIRRRDLQAAAQAMQISQDLFEDLFEPDAMAYILSASRLVCEAGETRPERAAAAGVMVGVMAAWLATQNAGR